MAQASACRPGTRNGRANGMNTMLAPISSIVRAIEEPRLPPAISASFGRKGAPAAALSSSRPVACGGCSGMIQVKPNASSGESTKLTTSASTTGSGRRSGAITSASGWLIPIASMLLMTKTSRLRSVSPSNALVMRLARSGDQTQAPRVRLEMPSWIAPSSSRRWPNGHSLSATGEGEAQRTKGAHHDSLDNRFGICPSAAHSTTKFAPVPPRVSSAGTKVSTEPRGRIAIGRGK